MHFLFVTGQLNSFGGVERTLSEKINYMQSRGHHTCVVTFAQNGMPPYFKLNNNISFYDVDCRYFQYYNLPLYKRLWKLLQTKRRFRKRLSDILQEFEPDTVIVTMAMSRFFINDIVKVANNIRIVIESHNIYNDLYHKVPISERFFYFFHHPLTTMSKASTLVVLTQQDAKSWESRNVKSIKVIPNPLPQYQERLSGCERKPGRIICVGRLATEKRYDRLIDAFALIADKYPSWYIDIFGDGPEKNHLQDILKARGLTERIHIHQPTSQIYQEYESSQMLVLSSDMESFGLVIIEAMACGTPVVSVKCPYGPTEIIEDGVTGLLAEVDAADLAEKMVWMMTHDAERTQMGIHAHLAAARYGKEQVMKEWEAVYVNKEV
jgi:glycosyltransferase involved in cell wall biosynthesis